MEKKEPTSTLFKDPRRLLNDIDHQSEILEKLIDIGLEYSKFHSSDSDASKWIPIMLQMSLCKINSIVQLSKGIKFNSSDIENNLIDVHSQSSIFRSLLENYCLFNHLFIQNWSKEEFTILYNLWRISSLNQRFDLISQNKTTASDTNKRKIQSEKAFVDSLIKEIKFTKIYQRNKKHLDNIIKKRRWQLTIESNEIKPISWKQLYLNTKKNPRKPDSIYQILSLDAHPTFYSVIQFNGLYKDRNDINRTKLILYQTIEILCAYLFDYRTLISNKTKVDHYSSLLINVLGRSK